MSARPMSDVFTLGTGMFYGVHVCFDDSLVRRNPDEWSDGFFIQVITFRNICFLLCDVTLTFQLQPCRGCMGGASPPGWSVQQNGLRTVKTDSGGLFSTRLLHLPELGTLRSAVRSRQFHSRGCSSWAIHWKCHLRLEKQPQTPPANVHLSPPTNSSLCSQAHPSKFHHTNFRAANLHK